MAQIWIREYDAKKMYFDFIWEKYTWKQIKIEDEKKSSILLWDKKYVIKPDMLFGKRWKMDLLGIWLEKNEILNWIEVKTKQKTIIGKITWKLTHFLIEDFIPHKKEYYLSFSTTRDYDLINFSFSGWVEIEENWEKVIEIKIPTLDNLSEEIILEKIFWDKLSKELNFWSDNQKENIINTLLNLWNYYKNYWFVYLEVNPFCFDEENWNLVLLDMVAKIDDTEFFRQKNNWKNLEFPSTFWFEESDEEKYIKKLDKQTWASLKFKILNKNAKIWTLLAGWGWSLVITDSLWTLWFADNIWNYWELSWNPTRELTREYTRKIIECMLENKEKGKYLIIAWAIANFTKIDTTFSGMIDVFEEKIGEIKKAEIKILVRRWWINEKEGLKIMKDSCERLWIYCEISDSWEYMTDILKKIKY
jgi:ATP-citrate lyase beta-subunit